MDWEAEFTRGGSSSTSRNQNARVGPSSSQANSNAMPSLVDRARSSAMVVDDEDDAPPGRGTSRTTSGLALNVINGDETPLEQLTRHWLNERHSPEILPAQEVLLGNLLDHVRRQTDTVQLLRGDPTASEDEHLRMMLVQTEVERVKFVIRSYVRARLFKIEKHARWITTNPEVQTRITTAERDYASRHAHLTDRHLYFSVLQSLPDAQAHLDDTPVFMPPMITEPDRSRFVFARALKDGAMCRLPNGQTLELRQGQISLLPYFTIEELLEGGEIELV